MAYGVEVVNNNGNLIITENSSVLSFFAYGNIAQIQGGATNDPDARITVNVDGVLNTDEFVVYTTSQENKQPEIIKGTGTVTFVNSLPAITGSTYPNIIELQYWVFRVG